MWRTSDVVEVEYLRQGVDLSAVAVDVESHFPSIEAWVAAADPLSTAPSAPTIPHTVTAAKEAPAFVGSSSDVGASALAPSAAPLRPGADLPPPIPMQPLARPAGGASHTIAALLTASAPSAEPPTAAAIAWAPSAAELAGEGPEGGTKAKKEKGPGVHRDANGRKKNSARTVPSHRRTASDGGGKAAGGARRANATVTSAAGAGTGAPAAH
jgi:hypothetical protein